MPFVRVVAGKLRDRAIEIHRKAEETGDTWDVAYRHGFFDGLRELLSSETMGMLIMDCDAATEGEEPYTDSLPRVVLAEDTDAE